MKYLVLFFVSSNLYAAGAGGPMDLVAPFTNVIILVGLIIYLTRNTIKSFFSNKSKSIKDMMERAAVKAKEAEVMLQAQEKKIKALDAEINKLNKEAEEELVEFEKKYKVEVENRIQKLKEDAGQKINSEKAELLNQLNSRLIEEVLEKTRNKLRGDSSLSENATKNLLEELR